MFVVMWDSKPVMSQESDQRPSTPYLRGTIVAGTAGGGNFAGRRCLAWGDSNPGLAAMAGKAQELGLQLRDSIRVKGSTQESLVVDGLRVKKTFEGPELDAIEQQVVDAQALNLQSRGAREITRPVAPGTTPAPAPAAPGLAAGLPEAAEAPAVAPF